MAEKKKVSGTVDRVEGGVVVIVAKDPDSGENREIYVKQKQFKRIEPKEGDDVTVEMSRMVADLKSDTVSLVFTGIKTGEMAKRFFSYLVDGGLEDQLIQELSGKGLTLEISGCSKKNLSVSFQCSKEAPAKKTAKKPAKPAAKKVPAKRTKKG